MKDRQQSECAAWTRNVPLDQLVEEVPAMRQSAYFLAFPIACRANALSVDIRGDATGYFTAGTASFLSLQYVSSIMRILTSR